MGKRFWHNLSLLNEATSYTSQTWQWCTNVPYVQGAWRKQMRSVLTRTWRGPLQPLCWTSALHQHFQKNVFYTHFIDKNKTFRNVEHFFLLMYKTQERKTTLITLFIFATWFPLRGQHFEQLWRKTHGCFPTLSTSKENPQNKPKCIVQSFEYLWANWWL